MHFFFHSLLCIVAGFLAIWATAINAMRWFEEDYSGIWLWVVSVGLMALAFIVGTVHV